MKRQHLGRIKTIRADRRSLKSPRQMIRSKVVQPAGRITPPEPKPLSAAVPSPSQTALLAIQSMRISVTNVYQMSDREVKRLRSKLYRINSEGRQRFFTRLINGALVVCRIQ